MGIQNKNTIKILLGLTVISLVVLLVFYVSDNKDDSPNMNQPKNDAQTTSTVGSAQPTFSEGTEKAITEPQKKGSAQISDTDGEIESIPNETLWTTSDSGEISLYTPSEDSLLMSGDAISGESTLSNIQFRLIDEVSGVIAQGQLRVTDGRFSGNITYDTSAKNARLDIFGIRNDASEFSNIEVSVKLN